MFFGDGWLAIKGELELDNPDTFVKWNCIEVIEVSAEIVEEDYLAIKIYMESGNVVRGWIAKESLEI